MGYPMNCILYIFTPFLSQPACGAALAAVYSGQVTISLKTIPKRMGISSGEIFLTEVLFLRNVLFIVFAHGCFVNVDTPRHQSVDDNLRSSEFPNNRCKQLDDRINGWLIIIFI